eukprot:scaffold307523_cov19-Prasinocladus_malaysianus.AAC.1
MHTIMVVLTKPFMADARWKCMRHFILHVMEAYYSRGTPCLLDGWWTFRDNAGQETVLLQLPSALPDCSAI